MKTYNEEILAKGIQKAINEQNHFWWGCIIGLQYGSLSSMRCNEDEEPSYCVDTEEERARTFMPIVKVMYGSPYKSMSKTGHLVKWYSPDHEPLNVSYLRLKPEPEIFETGAKQDFINSLILFCDNTGSLVELRDDIYNDHKHEPELKPTMFVALCDSARAMYIREVEPEGLMYKNIDKMRYKKYYKNVLEFCQIYVDRFADWKSDHK
jgi:hypothetical protein